jgi:hypothetical protein
MRIRLPLVILLAVSFLAIISANSNVTNVMGSSSGNTGGGGTGGNIPAPHSSVEHSVGGQHPPAVRYLVIHVFVRVAVTYMITETLPVLRVVARTIQLNPKLELASPPSGLETGGVGTGGANNSWVRGLVGFGGGDLALVLLLVMMSVLSARRSRKGDSTQNHS